METILSEDNGMKLQINNRQETGNSQICGETPLLNNPKVDKEITMKIRKYL